MQCLKKFWSKIIQATYNIAIADIGEDMTPVNIRWMKHDYKDRWFADPFILEETPNTFVILAEEYVRAAALGRICKLTVEKTNIRLIRNETLLDIGSHLSFPNIINCGGDVFVYPENSVAGHLTFYRLSEQGLVQEALLPMPIIDPVLMQNNDECYILATLPKDSNANILHVYKSNHIFGPYEEIQQIPFGDNVARRAGNVFKWKGKTIAPAQICNYHYGEGISFQEIDIVEKGLLQVKEIKRLEAKEITKMTGFHTYNVFGKKAVIDGYKYGNEFIHDAYFKIRGLKIM